MNKQEVFRIKKKHQRELTDVYSVKSLALFGSVAGDEANPSSDVDMLVDFSVR
jgi:predicted nucleotidyltransferase